MDQQTRCTSYLTPMWRTAGMIGGLWFWSFMAVHSQDVLPFPSVQPANVTAFDIDAGLPITCTHDGLIDQKGRLWINPCFGQSEHRSFSFYQFDGKEAYDIDLGPMPDGVGGQAVLQGLGADEEMFGFFRESDDFFLYNSETGATRYFSLDKESAMILFMARDEDRGMILYATSDSQHFIYRFADDRTVLLKELRRHHIFEPDRDWYIKPPRLLHRGELWFLDRPYPYTDKEGGQLIRFNCITETIYEYPVEDFFGEKLHSDVFLTLHAHGDSLYRFDQSGWLFSYNLTNGKWKRRHLIPGLPNTISIAPTIASDASGNLLFICSQQDFRPRAVLRDIHGKYYDYDIVFRDIINASRYQQIGIHNVFGRDFLTEILVFVEGGLVVADMKLAGAIQTRFEQSPVRGIVEIENGKLLLAKEGGGLFEIPVEHTAEAEYKQFHVTCDQSRGPYFADLKKDHNDHLWYPWERDLIQVKNENECIVHPLGVRCDRFVFLSDSIILLTGEGQVLCYNVLTRHVSPCLKTGKSLVIESPVNQIMVARDRTIWIANLQGLWHLDLKKGNTEFFDRRNGFHDDRMMCLDEDDDGRIWVGTYAGGIHIFDPGSGEVRVINATNGLSNNTVVGILKDEEGVRWLSTYSGITLVSPEGNILTRLYQEDGLSTNEFNRYSWQKDNHGRLLFGSIKGLNVIEPEPIKARLLNRDALKIYFTSITYRDPGVDADVVHRYDFDHLDMVKLPAAHRYLKLKFALSSYIRASDKQFAYRFIGLHDHEEDWRSIGSNTELNLYDLPVGKYEIHIRGSDYRGNLTPKPLVLRIHAVGFFYQQAWFYGIIFLCLSGVGIAWLIYERSERRRLEHVVMERTRQITEDRDTIERQAEKLKELDIAKSRLFTNISHEFRTPLTVIEGMADHIGNDQKAPELIKRNARSLLNLVNQMLDLSKIEAGALKLELIHSDVVLFLRYVADSYHSLANLKALNFSFRSSVPELMMAFDQEKLRQILVNLLSNAIKFTDKGEIVLQLEKIKEKGQDWLGIHVSDTGCGIPRDKLDQVFLRFYQLDPSTGSVLGGTGIGLTLAAELVKLMDGNIMVESELGKGTTFHVKIPIKHEDAKTSAMEALIFPQAIITEDPQGPNRIPHSAEKANLLIVEDNPDVVYFLVTSLKENYNLHIAENGEQGITSALEVIPDLIISDVMMPIKDGFELCETLKKDIRTSHIPIVLLTAKADNPSHIAGLRRGADAYLAKPFNTEMLLVQVESLLSTRKLIYSRYQHIGPLEPTEDPGLQMEDAFIIALREFIEANLDNEDIQVPQICEAIGMSRAHLHRKISVLTGKSITAFVKSVRLIKAREFLSNPELNVSQVAFMVGFNYAETFSRAFHEEYGISPSEYRQTTLTARKSIKTDHSAS